MAFMRTADDPVPTDVVKPARAIDLRLVAESIDVDIETLHQLNPSLLRLATPDDPFVSNCIFH